MPSAAIKDGLNLFQKNLKGTWTNQALPNAPNSEGSQGNPLSYNVMPLPQDPPNYILKNFTLFETVQFSDNSDVALPVTAPNRGGDSLQLPTALFYEQQVHFAEGPGGPQDGPSPKPAQIIHVENGAWLNLLTGQPLVGPYAPIQLDDPNQQPPNITIAKQMSIPHGNSILALGSFAPPTTGEPTIPDAPSVLPTPAGLDTTPYTTLIVGTDNDNYQNPQPDLTMNPNKPLQQAIGYIRPNLFITWTVSTGNQGQTMNIPFEQRAANVTAYSASYWLLSTDNGSTYNYLAYTQNISLQFMIGGMPYTFPHLTSNVVTRVAVAG